MLLLQQNVHPKVVQERLGHSQINVTLDTYSHLVPGRQEKAARAFADALREEALPEQMSVIVIQASVAFRLLGDFRHDSWWGHEGFESSTRGLEVVWWLCCSIPTYTTLERSVQWRPDNSPSGCRRFANA